MAKNKYNLDAQIEGWDQSELADMLGVEDSDNEDAVTEGLKELWSDLFDRKPEASKALQWIRQWLHALAERNNRTNSFSAVYKALAEIERDQPLMQAVIQFLPLCWN